jgi:hypothetical protein
MSTPYIIEMKDGGAISQFPHTSAWPEGQLYLFTFSSTAYDTIAISCG